MFTFNFCSAALCTGMKSPALQRAQPAPTQHPAAQPPPTGLAPHLTGSASSCFHSPSPRPSCLPTAAVRNPAPEEKPLSGLSQGSPVPGLLTPPAALPHKDEAIPPLLCPSSPKRAGDTGGCKGSQLSLGLEGASAAGDRSPARGQPRPGGGAGREGVLAARPSPAQSRQQRLLPAAPGCSEPCGGRRRWSRWRRTAAAATVGAPPGSVGSGSAGGAGRAPGLSPVPREGPRGGGVRAHCTPALHPPLGFGAVLGHRSVFLGLGVLFLLLRSVQKRENSLNPQATLRLLCQQQALRCVSLTAAAEKLGRFYFPLKIA